MDSADAEILEVSPSSAIQGSEHEGPGWWTVWHKVDELLAWIKGRKEAFWFMRPVDEKKDHAPNYYHIIAFPVDLRTITQKVPREGQKVVSGKPLYTSPLEVDEDMKLMLRNCRTYNQSPDMPVRMDAIKLEEEWNRRWAASGITEVWEKLIWRMQATGSRHQPSAHLPDVPPSLVSLPVTATSSDEQERALKQGASLLRAAGWLPRKEVLLEHMRAELLGGHESSPNALFVRCLCVSCCSKPPALYEDINNDSCLMTLEEWYQHVKHVYPYSQEETGDEDAIALASFNTCCQQIRIYDGSSSSWVPLGSFMKAQAEIAGGAKLTGLVGYSYYYCIPNPQEPHKFGRWQAFMVTDYDSATGEHTLRYTETGQSRAFIAASFLHWGYHRPDDHPEISPGRLLAEKYPPTTSPGPAGLDQLLLPCTPSPESIGQQTKVNPSFSKRNGKGQDFSDQITMPPYHPAAHLKAIQSFGRANQVLTTSDQGGLEGDNGTEMGAMEPQKKVTSEAQVAKLPFLQLAQAELPPLQGPACGGKPSSALLSTNSETVSGLSQKDHHELDPKPQVGSVTAGFLHLHQSGQSCGQMHMPADLRIKQGSFPKAAVLPTGAPAVPIKREEDHTPHAGHAQTVQGPVSSSKDPRNSIGGAPSLNKVHPTFRPLRSHGHPIDSRMVLGTGNIGVANSDVLARLMDYYRSTGQRPVSCAAPGNHGRSVTDVPPAMAGPQPSSGTTERSAQLKSHMAATQQYQVVGMPQSNLVLQGNHMCPHQAVVKNNPPGASVTEPSPARVLCQVQTVVGATMMGPLIRQAGPSIMNPGIMGGVPLSRDALIAKQAGNKNRVVGNAPVMEAAPRTREEVGSGAGVSLRKCPSEGNSMTDITSGTRDQPPGTHGPDITKDTPDPVGGQIALADLPRGKRVASDDRGAMEFHVAQKRRSMKENKGQEGSPMKDSGPGRLEVFDLDRMGGVAEPSVTATNTAGEPVQLVPPGLTGDGGRQGDCQGSSERNLGEARWPVVPYMPHEDPDIRAEFCNILLIIMGMLQFPTSKKLRIRRNLQKVPGCQMRADWPLLAEVCSSQSLTDAEDFIELLMEEEP